MLCTHGEHLFTTIDSPLHFRRFSGSVITFGISPTISTAPEIETQRAHQQAQSFGRLLDDNRTAEMVRFQVGIEGLGWGFLSASSPSFVTHIQKTLTLIAMQAI